MKFEIKHLEEGGYRLISDFDEYGRLIQLGDIWLYKENEKGKSCCCQDESIFNYHGIEKGLLGKIYEPFILKRILIIQMK